MKYVLVSGGVISGIGKGIIASSTGLLLKTRGLKVTAIKIDPYLNVDAGLMKPTEHGEVYVLNDGSEVDLDLGNYERYLHITLTRDNNITTGKIYQHVIEKERKGDYLGKTVQIVPHLTDALQDWIERVARIPVDDTHEEPDVCIIELGGTVGDIESGPFIEAMRQLRRRAGKNNFMQIHVSLVPIVNGEQKTKPTQAAIKDVRSAGLSPDLIACRCEKALEAATIEKVSRYCDVELHQVIAVQNVASTYHVPVLLEQQGFVHELNDLLKLDSLDISSTLLRKGSHIMSAWKSLTTSQDHVHQHVTIAMVGKYTSFGESYLSVIKSLEHAAMACHRKLDLRWIDAEHLEDPSKEESPQLYHEAWSTLHKANGILIPGGFGQRGTEGMIAAAHLARTKKIPYLGICLGMQTAVIEFARNAAGITNAGSEEFGKLADDRVIIFMPEIDTQTMGGNMRLGLKETHFQPGSEWSKLRALYEAEKSAVNVHSSSSNNADTGNLTNGIKSTDLADGEAAIEPSLSSKTKSQNPQPSSSSSSSIPPSSPPPPPPLIVLERHRHRYEVSPSHVPHLSSQGLHFIGKDSLGVRMEILELKDHPWFVGVQFHPEYLSRVLRPSKPYLGFVASAVGEGAFERVERRGRERRGSVGWGASGEDGVAV